MFYIKKLDTPMLHVDMLGNANYLYVLFFDDDNKEPRVIKRYEKYFTAKLGLTVHRAGRGYDRQWVERNYPVTAWRQATMRHMGIL